MFPRGTLIHVLASKPFVSVPFVMLMAVAAVRSWDIEAVTVVTAAVRFRCALVDVAALVVGCRDSVNVPARGRIGHRLGQSADVIGVRFLAVVMLRRARIL